MSKITESANGQDCQIRIIGVCTNRNVVWCHAIGLSSGKGMRKKSPDILGAYGCEACHDAYDRRIKPRDISYEQIEMDFHHGHQRSVVILNEMGLI